MFFSSTAKLKIPLSLVPRCGACGYYKNAEYAKTKPQNKGNKILFVTEGVNDKGTFLTNEEYVKLESVLDNLGISLSRDCQITGNLICPDKKRIDYTTASEHCRPNLINCIKENDYVSVVLLGPKTFSLMHYLWKKDNIAWEKWIGWKIPSQLINSWVFPTYAVNQTLGERKGIENLIFQNCIKNAIRKKDKPFEKIPKYIDEIEIVYQDKTIIHFIDKMMKEKKEIAWDLETTMLKPDSTEAEIISCSISDGKQTIAFNWTPVVAEGMKKILTYPKCGKIASNLKFEHRWIKRKLGVDVVNWTHDTMLAAHILDNRGGISSIKFQSFVLLGQPDYDTEMKQYLKSKEGGGYGLNTIRKAPVKELLLYNGLDSLLEYKVAQIQKRQMEKQ